MKKILLTYFLFGFTTIFSQEITGKVIHFITKKGIADVAIQTNKNIGTVTNKEGVYSIPSKNVAYVSFSSLGFKTKTLSLDELELNNYIVVLEETSTILKEIELSFRKISLDSLLIKTKKSMVDNYVTFPTKSKFYVNNNQVFDFKKINLNFKSSSLLDKKDEELAKTELQDFANTIKKSKPDIPKVFFGNLETMNFHSEKFKKDFLQKKLDSILGFTPLDPKKSFSLNELQNKTQQLVLKYLNKNKTYKIKSGLFKIEDSISLIKSKKIKDTMDIKNTFTPFKPLTYINDAFKKAQFFKADNENNFLNSNFYDHELLKKEFIRDKSHYVIRFSPRKSKAKYEGKIYVNPTDFTITKISYQYAKGKSGEHLNLKLLLGVKYAENKKTGTLYFEKNKKNKLYLAYFKESIGRYTYANRPFKLIENSDEKNKIKLSLKLEFDMNEITEVFFYNYQLQKENKVSKPLEKGFLMKRYPYVDDKISKLRLQKAQQELVNFLNEHQ